MAEETESQDPEAGAEGEATPKVPLKTPPFIPMILIAGIVALGSGAGFALSRLVTSGGEVQEARATQPEPTKQPPLPPDGSQEFVYYDFDPILVTLNEKRQDRFMRITIKLVLGQADHEVAAKIIETKKPELKDWLIVHLSGYTLEDVAGDKNKNRLKRRILDSFNEQLWPGRRPLIAKVILEECAIQ